MTLTTDWGWVKNPVYKTPNRIISILMEVVAKGGNLLLGVGPTAEGLIEQPTVKRLQEIGRWMQKNGKAIYHTRITPITIVGMFGSLPIRMAEPFMRYTLCLKEKRCLLSLSGRECS